jgi:hypothetical protein
MYNKEVMCIYDLYFKSVAESLAERLGDDDTLPMSGIRIVPKEAYIASTGGTQCLNTSSVYYYYYYYIINILDLNFGPMY